LAACASAHAPIAGISASTSTFDADSASVQASVPQAAPCATTPMKYTLNTAVSTTVV
jgi:hypothetical protein